MERTTTLIDGRRIVNPGSSYQDAIARIDGRKDREQRELQQYLLDNATPAGPQPKPSKIGSYCECGAPYVFLERFDAWGYSCAR